jgi:hypothetical protein
MGIPTSDFVTEKDEKRDDCTRADGPLSAAALTLGVGDGTGGTD